MKAKNYLTREQTVQRILELKAAIGDVVWIYELPQYEEADLTKLLEGYERALVSYQRAEKILADKATEDWSSRYSKEFMRYRRITLQAHKRNLVNTFHEKMKREWLEDGGEDLWK